MSQIVLLTRSLSEDTARAASGIGPVTWDGIATVLAALIGAIILVAGFRHERKLQTRARRAEAYAGALQAVSDYLEVPYRIRRRSGIAEDRVALTAHISEIQSRLDFNIAHLALVAPPPTHAAYVELVNVAKTEAGPQMTAAWRARPTRRDRDVPLVSPYPHPLSDRARQATLEAMAR